MSTETQLVRFAQAPIGTNEVVSLYFHATKEAAATVASAGHFNFARGKLKVGDVIFSFANIGAATAQQNFRVTAVPAAPGNVTTQATGVVVGGQTAIADLAGALTGATDGTLADVPVPADAPATVDALRDDIALNVVPAINEQLKELQAKLNAILAGQRASGHTLT